MILRLLILSCFFTLSSFAAPLKVPREQFYKDAENTQNHPGHLPFISCLTFRNLCNHAIDQNTDWFDPDLVKQGDLIYLNVWYLHWFAHNVHDQIKVPYILVSGDVGDWIPRPEIKKFLYDPKLAAWFCRNIVFSHHPKFFQLPMGQDFSLFTLDIHAAGSLSKEAAASYPKKHLLYMNHYPREHGDRQKVVELFENAPYCFSRNRSHLPYEAIPVCQYFQELASSYFALSPIGLELDSVRTWEALALGTIPIVEHTFLDPIYEGLPVLIITDWEEINQPFLERKYQELKNVKREKAFFNHWAQLICETQRKVQNNDSFFSRLEATQFSEPDLNDLRLILSESSSLIYKGFLTSARPLQLAKEFSFLSSISVYDPWLDPETFHSFDRYWEDQSLTKNKEKIHVIDIPYILDRPQTLFHDTLNKMSGNYAIFLDLTYYRNSLLNNFVKDFTHPRHLLKRDLRDLYERIPLFSMLSGNAAQDPFVNEVLEQLSREIRVTFERRGAFWYVQKGL